MIHTIGLGTRKLTGDDCYRAVRTALDIGYRYIDTAAVYHNHNNIAQALQSSLLDRSSYFLTSKIWLEDFNRPRQAVECMIRDLKIDYLDLVLLHRPTTKEEHHRVIDMVLQLRQEGKIRHIGISNFSYSQLDDAIAYLGSDLYAVQYEYHVCLDQLPILDRCRQHNIQFQAYSPLAHGKLGNDRQTMIALEYIAQKNNLTVSQVMLSWLLDQQVLVLPKSTSSVHLKDNFLTPIGVLSDEDRECIAGFPKHFRYCNPSAIAPNRNA